MAKRKDSGNSKPKKTTNRRFRAISRGIRPGSKAEYLWNHPEIVNAHLREFGIDPDEIDRILERGGGKLPYGKLGKKD